MLRHLLLVLLTFPLFASNWSLQDRNDGWNSADLVRLYFHNSELQTQWAWEALSNYTLPRDAKVLDFGCGEGKLSSALASLVPQGSVTAVDTSKEMINFATKMFQREGLSFMELSDVDFSSHFLTESFDVITSFCVFHVVPRPSTVLRNLHAILKPGGHLVLTLPIGGNAHFFKAASDELRAHGWSLPAPTKGSISMRNPATAVEILEEAGFEVLYSKPIECRFPFSSKKELVDWFEGTLSANWKIPAESRRDFFESLTDRYLSENPSEMDEDGFVYFYIKRLDVVARSKK